MITHLPIFISLIFGITSILTLLLFVWAIKNASAEFTRKKSKMVFALLSSWLVIQMIIAYKGIYVDDIHNFPPKLFYMGVLPTFIIMIFLFVTKSGRDFVDGLPAKNLTYLKINPSRFLKP